MSVLIADTSGLVALINRADRAHAAVRAVVAGLRRPLLVPDLVIAEVDYLVSRMVGRTAEELFLADLVSGALEREPLTHADLTRAAELVGTYADHDIGVVDASIVALAERVGTDRVLTLDLRHFRTFRLGGRRPFTILPADGDG